jgi:uncharacterized protein (DUF433 family)
LACDAIEAVPGKLAGAPVIEASRVRPGNLINTLDLTEEELASEFGPDQTVGHEVLRFYHRHTGRLAHHP